MSAKAPIRERGIPEQKSMCEFLRATPSNSNEYDFAKGEIRFEYKWSKLYLLHPKKVRDGREGVRHDWVWADIWGDSNSKSFDFLVLEGSLPSAGSRREAGTETFLVPAGDLMELEKREGRRRNRFQIQIEQTPRAGLLTRFIWAHRRPKQEIRSWLEEMKPGTLNAGPSSNQYDLFAKSELKTGR